MSDDTPRRRPRDEEGRVPWKLIALLILVVRAGRFLLPERRGRLGGLPLVRWAMAALGRDRHRGGDRHRPRPAGDVAMAAGAPTEGEQLSGREPLFSVESTDAVSVAVHELTGSSSGPLSGSVSGPPLLISHATGFCGHAYGPVAAAFGDRFRSLAMDHRGHGATPAPQGWETGAGVDWRASATTRSPWRRRSTRPGRSWVSVTRWAAPRC